MTKLCPNCFESIKKKAKKCRYCDEAIIHESTWASICRKFEHWKTDGWFWGMIILAPLVVFLVPNVPFGWKSAIALIIEALVLIAFLRPFNTQMGIPIAFLSLLLSASAFFHNERAVNEQKKVFEARNRPYIQISSNIKLEMTGAFRINNPTKLVFQDSFPEPQFNLLIPFVNYGPVPASVLDIEIAAHHEKEKLMRGDGVVLGVPPDNKERGNFDVFPIFQGRTGVANVFNHMSSFYLSVNDIKKVLSRDIDSSMILKTTEAGQSENKIWDSALLNSIKTETWEPFYLKISIRYFALGEQDRRERPYEYWVIFKYDERSKGFIFRESGLT